MPAVCRHSNAIPSHWAPGGAWLQGIRERGKKSRRTAPNAVRRRSVRTPHLRLLPSADRPEHGVVQQRLEPPIPPHRLLVAKGGVEYTTAAVGAGPCQRPAIGMPVDEVAREIDGRRVEAQQHMGAAD